eukprot:symbB.v1.2.031874.t1/scaffold3748.1/size51016/2
MEVPREAGLQSRPNDETTSRTTPGAENMTAAASETQEALRVFDESLEEEIETFGRMAQALRQTWLTNSSFVVLPEKGAEPPGLLESLDGLQTLHLPPESSRVWGLRALHFWHFVVSLMDDGAPSCDWIMKVPVSSYVNVPTLQARLGCFNATEMFFLGAPTVAYSAGQDPFMFPNQLGGVIVSRGFFDHLTPGDEMRNSCSQGILGGSSQDS